MAFTQIAVDNFFTTIKRHSHNFLSHHFTTTQLSASLWQQTWYRNSIMYTANFHNS